MKKLFSIALVIAMAISCLAIFPSAGVEGDYIISTEFSEDGKTLYLTIDVDITVPDADDDTASFDLVVYYDSTKISAVEDDPRATFTSDSEKDICTWTYVSDEDGEIDCYIEIEEFNDLTTHAKKLSATYPFTVLAAEGETIELEADMEFCAITIGTAAYFRPTDVSGLTTVVPAAGAEEPEEPTYEAPAAAEYQTLAGCEVCGTAAGVRFIATVDAAADAFGMYITSGDKTVKLSSTDAGFKVKAETADTITFTAVIFSDLKFTVEVFEVYGETEVKSVAGTN